MNTKTVLDRVFTRIKDNSAAMRVMMLGWLNSAMQDVVNERTWLFLDKTESLPITASTITLPVDFGRETFIRVGNYLFTIGDRLTPEQAAIADSAGGDPWGYTVGATTLVFHPTASGTADLSYTAAFPATDYVDDAETLFPDEFIPLFERYLLTCFYEYDVDMDRLPVGVQIDAAQLRRMKKLDNQRKPLPQLNSRGLARE